MEHKGKHYGGKENPFEAIKIINHYDLNFSLGNVIKYILRQKGTKLEDLKKAKYYLENEIAKHTTNQNEKPA